LQKYAIEYDKKSFKGNYMFIHLESKSDISTAQHALERTIRDALNRAEWRGIGFPGGDVKKTKVHTDGKYWFRTAHYSKRETPSPRRLNWFGFYRENDGYHLSITVEINTAYKDRNDGVGGFFGRDASTGKVYLFHSGRVGGGTNGVGKNSLFAWAGLRPEKIVDASGAERFGVLIMPVEGKGAIRGLFRYIDQIAAFKQAVREGELVTSTYKKNRRDLETFYSESSGKRSGRRSSLIDYVSRHGDVVDALYAWRKARTLSGSSKIIKTVLIDLGVRNGSELVEVFEVKTSVSRADIYTAIGQLIVHGCTNKCRRMLVVPAGEPLTTDLNNALARLNIETLRFTLGEKSAEIVRGSTRTSTFLNFMHDVEEPQPR